MMHWFIVIWLSTTRSPEMIKCEWIKAKSADEAIEMIQTKEHEILKNPSVVEDAP